MFSKPTNANKSAAPPAAPTRSGPSGPAVLNSPQPAKTPVAAPRMSSSLGPDLILEGSIHGDGELMIDGAIKGDVHVAHLIIGENAHVEGTVRCGAVEVRGRVIGNIEAQTVKLHETAFVEGDITHGQLSIDVGAYFQGRCQQFRPEQPVAHAPAAEPVAAAVEYDSGHHG